MSKISATANLSAHPTWRQCQFGTFEATGEVLLLLTTTELFGLRLNETTTQLRAHLLDHLDKLCEASYFYVFVSKGKGPEMQLAGVATILVCLLARVSPKN